MNELQYESSPYLLQHARNPVDWKAWNKKNLAFAKESNKLIIVSIGYSTCHWCHVMEHESFEKEEVAQLMNTHFISIKVDREERPDVDAYYMKAVQLMNQRGGWPLHAVCLPDGRPVWGGTYFRKHQWMEALTKLHELFVSEPEALVNYADELDKDIADAGKAPIRVEYGSKFDLAGLVEAWRRYFDPIHGGQGKAPKFMLSNSLYFLQKYACLNNDEAALAHVNLTLTRMARGGLFDTVQGGFSRYSVDERWHIPHFEKMLYDNAQLLSVYADGYKRTKNPLYNEVIVKTIRFLVNEWSNGEGGFYSAYDADSVNRNGHLEEGAFYSWTLEELQAVIDEKDFPVFREVFDIYPERIWENEAYVLLQADELENIALKYNLSPHTLVQKKAGWENALHKEREKRPKPRLDDKTLTSWNALLIVGLLESYSALGNNEYLKLAENIGRFIDLKLCDENAGLKHTYKNGEAAIDGFLEDYAFYIAALIALYEHTLDTGYLSQAKNLTDRVIVDFFDKESGFFFFSNKNNDAFIHNAVEIDDGVIPSANSQMLHNLYKLGILFENTHYADMAERMLETMRHTIHSAPYSSNWLLADLYMAEPAELLVSGKEALNEILKLRKNIVTHTFLCGCTEASDIPYLRGKFNQDETLFFYCSNRICMLPQPSNDFLNGYRL